MSHSDSEIKTKNEKQKLKKHSFKTKEKFQPDSKKLRSRILTEKYRLNLINAVGLNDTEGVKRLLELGVSPNSSDVFRRSPLHIAVTKGYTEIVELLLRNGANPNIRDSLQNTPLHLASYTVNLPIIRMLCVAGADIQSLDIRGKNPLNLAESKLHILKNIWKDGVIEMRVLCSQLEEIVDVLIAKRRQQIEQQTECNRREDAFSDLQELKNALNDECNSEVDNQMDKILSELQQINIK